MFVYKLSGCSFESRCSYITHIWQKDKLYKRNYQMLSYKRNHKAISVITEQLGFHVPQFGTVNFSRSFLIMCSTYFLLSEFFNSNFLKVFGLFTSSIISSNLSSNLIYKTSTYFIFCNVHITLFFLILIWLVGRKRENYCSLSWQRNLSFCWVYSSLRSTKLKLIIETYLEDTIAGFQIYFKAWYLPLIYLSSLLKLKHFYWLPKRHSIACLAILYISG